MLFSAELPLQTLIAYGDANTKCFDLFLNSEILKVPPRSTMKSSWRDPGATIGRLDGKETLGTQE